jgi:formylglycine-generating enzyme required for sulfatase activity
MDLPQGYLLQDRYRIEKVLGQGGFGITYLAYDQYLSRQVAIKELYISGSSTRSSDQTVQSVKLDGIPFSDFKAKFLREARELAGIEHPHIVRVHDFFEANNTAYYTMGYVEGMNLQALVVKNGPLADDTAVNVITQLIDAVEALHQRKKLHRDLKPANVMISNQWKVVLIDFGTTRDFGDGRTLSTVAMVSQGYSPLEQYGEQSLLDERSDIYALGATMYFLLTGRRPTSAPDRQVSGLVAPYILNASVQERLSQAVMQAMAMDASERFASVGEFRKALSAVLPGDTKPSESHHVDPIQQLINNMILVKGGAFTMGCTSEQGSECWDWERPSHFVTVSSFLIGKYTVTQAQWRAVMGKNPERLYNKGCDQCPVEGVSWEDVQTFIQILNSRTGMHFRLPTEAEWEYAARGGSQSRGFKYSGSNNINEVAWFESNAKADNAHGSRKTTRPVGQKKANELGIYDMSGNVWEWCNDWYTSYNIVESTNPMGPSSGSCRVRRGGSWSSNSRGCRVSVRSDSEPLYYDGDLGFRLASDP